MRLTDGADRALFEDRTGLDWSAVAPVIDRAVAAGTLEWIAAGQFRPTGLGMRFLNELLVDFLPSGAGT
ncbi:MAG: hypothetical protein EBS39_07570 [Gammaproteobacteria bacterium]|nr:hypothetical protein [Gammaproteobacteria bacterium]